MDNAAQTTGPHFVDRHVGLRIRMRRKEVGISQTGLAEALDLTFQQIQKYERGANRVSASKLYEIARVLQVPIPYFFEGLDQQHTGRSVARSTVELSAFLMTPHGLDLSTHFPRIPRAARNKIVELVRALARLEEDEPAAVETESCREL